MLFKQVEHPDKNSRILEVACSGGLFIKLLRDRGFDICGIDISENAINLCNIRGKRCLSIHL